MFLDKLILNCTYQLGTLDKFDMPDRGEFPSSRGDKKAGVRNM